MTEPTLEDFITLLRDPDPDVRRNAAWSLGRFRDPRITAPLIDALQDDNSGVRLRVAEALGNLRDEEAVIPLIAALSDDDPRVRAEIVTSLGRQGDYRAVDALVALLRDGESVVRAAAAQVFSLLPDRRAVGPLVTVLLDDEDDSVRYYAARSLGQIGGAETVTALLAALQGEPSAISQIRIAEILAMLGDRRAVEPLRALAQNDDEEVSTAARWALGQLGEG
jgi:HEAT repeat protein